MFYTYASILADAVPTNHYVQPFTPATGTAFSVTFTVPQANATTVSSSAVGNTNLARPLDFIPTQLFVEFLNYNPNASSTVYISNAVLTLD